MQINSNQLAPSKVEVNKSIGTNQAAAVTVDAADPVLPIQAQQSYQFNDYNEDAAALKSRLGAHIEYENETRGHRGAVAEYLTNQHAAKREEIQQMVGIDTYA
ncbi:hypothetical protein JK628_12775 [Shewanella sp. KX20019]|uniref:hypothetical protein n=1 Tax=Shewanella sp. KX20019 TaxID=2803864 RepID=UPI001927FF42|nr:hypothetical protein [Shewanella sp. KX20019]QQX78460.1 hypothetical protein JK628_12775 [Shewanella sp. KX20019]